MRLPGITRLSVYILMFACIACDPNSSCKDLQGTGAGTPLSKPTVEVRDTTIQLPQTEVEVEAIVTSSWVNIEWTGAIYQVKIDSLNSSNTKVKIKGLTVGTKRFRVTVNYTQYGGILAKVFDEFDITVLDAGAPTADAGHDKTIELPETKTTLGGSGTGSNLKFLWTQKSGPAATIISPSAATTNVTGLTTAGEYVFQLKVTDYQGLSAVDEVKVTVNAGLPTDINTFKVSKNVFKVSQTSKIINNNFSEHYFSVSTQRNANPQGDMLFTFFKDTSFPAINTTRHYEVVGNNTMGHQIRVRTSHSRTNNNFYNFYFSTDANKGTVDIENRNGLLYLTMTETVFTFTPTIGSADTIHVSATVHECPNGACP